MWPFSTIRKLRKAIVLAKEARSGMVEMLNRQTSRISDLQMQNHQQSETIRHLTEELEQARKNDMRGPDLLQIAEAFQECYGLPNDKLAGFEDVEPVQPVTEGMLKALAAAIAKATGHD